jgi:hypothetical protein
MRPLEELIDTAAPSRSRTNGRGPAGDRCYFFVPFLFTREGQGGRGSRRDVPVDQAWGVQMDFIRQMAAQRE